MSSPTAYAASSDPAGLNGHRRETLTIYMQAGRCRLCQTDMPGWQDLVADSDEHYLLDLCDEIFGIAGSRRHRFPWLVGDPGRNGARRRLLVDGYWPELSLVVEYREKQHDQAVTFFDKPERMTVSGVHRGEQRRLYDLRREELIPEHGLRLVVIAPGQLDSKPNGRLRRSREHDLKQSERSSAADAAQRDASRPRIVFA